MEFLRRKHVSNIQQSIQGPLNTHLIGEGVLEKDIREAIKYLVDEGYRVEEFSLAESKKRGFTFAKPEQLEKLTKFGWLTLIDSTQHQ